MNRAIQYGIGGDYHAAQIVAEGWAVDGCLAIVARTDQGLYMPSQWKPEVFIEVFKRDQDSIDQDNELNKAHGFGPTKRILDTSNMDIYLASNTWLDGAKICIGNPNNFEWEEFDTDIEAIQDYFKIS